MGVETGRAAVPRVVIIGAGFAGLRAARALRKSRADVTVIDRRNHHLFQPLLYQVATAMLSPAQIASTIRQVLRKQKNARVVMGEVVGIDVDRRVVQVLDGGVNARPGGDPDGRAEGEAHDVGYDYLVLATGATHSYFGNDGWARFAPGLKTIEDALEIRRRFLLAFEAAERETDASERRRELTFVIVGGGPTGVEMAGAIAEIARRAMPAEFRMIDTTTARVVLVEALDRVLPTFAERLSLRARKDLERLGVDVWLNTRVTGIDARGVSLGADRLDAANVIWAAGVRASRLGAMVGAATDRAGRVEVGPDLAVPGHSEIFVCGDLARVVDAKGDEVPGMAPGAMQMGTFAGRTIARELAAKDRGSTMPERKAFRYKDKGQLATIGRGKAVALIGGRAFGGFAAWLLWAFVHIFYLIGFRNRVVTMLDWAWNYVTFKRGARLITGVGREETGTETRHLTTKQEASVASRAQGASALDAH